ncbi:FKBP-type peptidyl-prolyl cis-trans isomerase [Rhodopirellula bahusiensis]|uniref:Peptidyl-prolyl cis-trans isomerase n=1 Tax=Rhodopirellula bahusiensis TaxID=2014065 RepID=A0A2G1WE38_9BACT|nr:FKBP-type peptidyl-prolyl cis-trans isomerase [Rhodopirellula bahusiensis]PHQ37288.1 peptidylprolyl isomerase [Rhodopirellula bahusiensis]
MKTWLPGCLLGLLFIAPACRSTAPTSPPIVPEPDFPVAQDSAPAQRTSISFLDKPELQADTGPMDASPAPDFSETDSGLNYRVLRHSDGRKPTAASTVTVHYRGWLDNGKEFDSSYERGEPTTFPLGSVVAGWTEGLQLVGEGGMIELWVPSHLGYGERGSPGSIPAHAHLHFIVELVSID